MMGVLDGPALDHKPSPVAWGIGTRPIRSTRRERGSSVSKGGREGCQCREARQI